MPEHPTRDVLDPFSGEQTPIDVELAELLSRVWQRGIRTSACCQDGGSDWAQHEGKAYVVFPTIFDAQRFLEIAANSFSEELESLYNRVVFNGASIELDDDWFRRRRFTVECWAADANRDYVWDEGRQEEVPVVLGPPEISLSIAVYFPQSDFQELERRFA